MTLDIAEATRANGPAPTPDQRAGPVDRRMGSAPIAGRRIVALGLAAAAAGSSLLALARPELSPLCSGATFVAAAALAATLLGRTRGAAVAPGARDGAPAELFELDATTLGPVARAASIGMATVSLAGVIVNCNQALARILGRSRLDLIGSSLIALVAPDDRERLLHSMAPGGSAPDEQARPIDVAILGLNKRVVSLHIGDVLADAPARADGEGGGARPVHVIDITSFKDLENQMLQARKMQAVGQLAGGIAHDFNNLLTAILGFCDLLLLRHRAGDPSFADLMQIRQNANRAASLVGQLLAFSRQQKLRPKVMDVTDTLAELTHLLRRLIGPSVVLNMTHSRDVGPVLVDQSQFEQVIINLAVNARDAMPGGGVLTIVTGAVSFAEPTAFGHELAPPGDYVLIEVTDTGSGIPEEVMPHIFEPFFSTKEVGQGTGLGLSTVYGIVRQTAGYIAVTNEPPCGAAFRIYLPVYAGPLKVSQDNGDAAERGELNTSGCGLILLVEDEDPVRLFTARALRNKGYRVLEARSGEAALDLLEAVTETIDLMITDAVMPVIDGPALIELVRAKLPDLRVICISGHTDEALRERIASHGDVLFLAKPFSLKQLALKVKEKLAN